MTESWIFRESGILGKLTELSRLGDVNYVKAYGGFVGDTLFSLVFYIVEGYGTLRLVLLSAIWIAFLMSLFIWDSPKTLSYLLFCFDN